MSKQVIASVSTSTSLAAGDQYIDMGSSLPSIELSNKITQHASTSSSDADSVKNLCYEEGDTGDYITDDEKISLGSEGKIIDSYLDDFLEREEELRKLMNLNNFNKILTNDIQFDEKSDESDDNKYKLNNEDSSILDDLETKLTDIQKRYNELMNIHVQESDSDDENYEGQTLQFDEARIKMDDIDKRLETINIEKSSEEAEIFLNSLPAQDLKYIEKEYLNSLNEMTKKLDNLHSDEQDEEDSVQNV